MEITGDAEIGRPPGLVHGADIDFPLAFQLGPLPLEPGQRYQWVLDIDGETQTGLAPDLQHASCRAGTGHLRRGSLTLGERPGRGGDAGTPLPAWQNEDRGS